MRLRISKISSSLKTRFMANHSIQYHNASSCSTEGLSAYVPVLLKTTRLATSSSTEHRKQENSTAEQLIELQSETTSGLGHNTSEAIYKPGHNTRFKQSHDHTQTTYKAGYNHSETPTRPEHGQRETTANLVYDQNETTKGIFTISEEQEERQLRLETNCQNMNSSMLQKLVFILSSILLFSKLSYL